MSLPTPIKVGGFEYKVYERDDFVRTQGSLVSAITTLALFSLPKTLQSRCK